MAELRSALASGKISPARRAKDRIFQALCLGAAVLGVILLGVVLWGAVREGFGSLSSRFFNGYPTASVERAGIKPALIGTLWVVALTLGLSLPIGIAAAIYLEEIAKKNRINQFVQANIANLAGVPSIIYGILGLATFVRFFGMGSSIIAASCTMSLLVMPTVILTTQEALRTVPKAYREGSLACGATHWQTLLKMTLPCALPPIFTGMILAASRAIGETAPLLVVGVVASTREIPQSLRDPYTVLPIQIYNWSSMPQQEWHDLAAAAIIVLLAMLLSLNAIAIILRNKTKKD